MSPLIKGGLCGLKCEICNERPFNLDKANNGVLRRRVLTSLDVKYMNFEDQDNFFSITGKFEKFDLIAIFACLLYTSPSPRDRG